MVPHAVAVAERCTIPLADSGGVPTLFAEAWYDDGVVPWDTELSTGAKSKTATETVWKVGETRQHGRMRPLEPGQVALAACNTRISFE